MGPKVMSENPLVLLGVFLAATCMGAIPTLGAPHVITLDDRVGRVIYLQAINEWCTVASDHKIDYNVLRLKISHEEDEAWKLARSEQALRIASSKEEIDFRLSNTDPTLFCEDMYRHRNQPGYEILSNVFED